MRSLVVGELMRAIVSNYALKEATLQFAQFQPHKIGVGRAGAVVLTAEQTVKSWVGTLQPGEIILKADISNAYNSIDRAACVRGISR